MSCSFYFDIPRTASHETGKTVGGSFAETDCLTVGFVVSSMEVLYSRWRWLSIRKEYRNNKWDIVVYIYTWVTASSYKQAIRRLYFKTKAHSRNLFSFGTIQFQMTLLDSSAAPLSHSYMPERDQMGSR